MQLQQMAASFAQQGVAMEQYLQMTGIGGYLTYRRRSDSYVFRINTDANFEKVRMVH